MKSQTSGLRQFAAQIVTCLILLIIGTPTSKAQEPDKLRIVDTIWGFDDRVVVGQFVPLSILVDNLSDELVEGTLRLQCVQGMLNEVGGTLEEPLVVSGTSRRWVQFYPYIADSMATWHLTLVTADKEIKFDPIPQSRPLFEPVFSTNLNRKDDRMTVVILDPPGRLSRIPQSLKHMPNEIFPPYATATHSLHGVFLDHVPIWDVPRQDSFMSWLKRGGRLHILKDSNNQQLQFSGVMAALNEPQAEFNVEFGRVTRHDYQRTDLAPETVERVVSLKSGKPDLPENQEQFQFQQMRGPVTIKAASELFVGLRALTSPEHNWILLTLLAIVYIGLLFPGSFILSKNPRLPFYATYLSIIAAAIVFSMFFLFFGRRGYGESTAVNSFMIARSETKTDWSVFGMSHVFVTAGDEYSIDDKGHQTLLASGSESERVDADFTSGNVAKFHSRIPPFSGQPVVFQRRVTLDDWELKILDFAQTSDQLTELSIQTGPGFPSGENVICRVLHGRRVFLMKYDPKTRRLRLGNDAKKLTDFCSNTEFDAKVWGGGWGPFGRGATAPATLDDADETPREQLFRVSEGDLVSRSMLDDFAQRIEEFELPPGEIRLFVYSPIPEALELSFSADASRDGRVLYVLPMPLELTVDSMPNGN